uniref:P-type domain-containing protein n=1 Tax=Parascaris univalens TaxID=6257 RepID=A0A915AL47_PARUN
MRLMFEASCDGATVIRPLFFEFPNDDAAHQNDFQFMWGPAILIAPVLAEGTKLVYAYLPRNATWYSLRDDFGVKAQSGFSFFSAPLDRLPPVFLRGGYIIPRQRGGQTTAATRQRPFQLVIAVENSKSFGKLIWDDGESIVENFDQHDYVELHFNFTMNDTASQLILSLVKSASSLTVPNITSASILG